METTTISRDGLKKLLQENVINQTPLTEEILERNGFECILRDFGINTWRTPEGVDIVIFETFLSKKAKPIYTYTFVDDIDFSKERSEAIKWDDLVIQSEEHLKELIQYLSL